MAIGAGGSGGISGSRPVSRVLSWAAIHLGPTSPWASSDLPGDSYGPHAAATGCMPPYLVLLRVGFTLPTLLPASRCALTAPFHPYQPAAAGWRYLFCGTFRRLAPPRCYLAPCPVEPGLSSPSRQRRKERLPSRLPIPSLIAIVSKVFAGGSSQPLGGMDLAVELPGTSLPLVAATRMRGLRQLAILGAATRHQSTKR